MPAHKYARIERERRFLVNQLPKDLDEHGGFTRILDKYITDTRLRLRRIEAPDGEVMQYKLGQKYLVDDDDLASTIMTNIYLNEEEYALLAKLPGTRLVKRRHTYLYAGQRFSLDVFYGQLEGLTLCEIEIPETQTIDIDLPPFVGRELTQDVRFTGRELVETTAADLLELIKL